MRFGNSKTDSTVSTSEIKENSNIKMSNEINSNPNDISRIAKGMNIIKGEIETSHDVRFDGNFTGKIVSHGRIIIGETATLNGELICNNLDIWGVFNGTSFVKDTLSLKKNSSYKGEINTGKFVVELGARLEGSTKMITDDAFHEIVKDSSVFKPEPQTEPTPAPAPAGPSKK